MITGISTILGTTLGFGLLKIFDIMKETKERIQNQAFVIFKLFELLSTISAMKIEVNY